MSVEEISGGTFYMDQAALDNPPAAPSKYMFIVPAIAHVGRARIPDWNDAERTSLAEGEEAARSGIQAIEDAAKILHQAIMDEDVTIYSRRSSGGSLTAMPTADWINDYMGVNIARSSGGPAVHGSVYLFVDRGELERAFPLARPASDDATALGLEHLSPYLRLMIHLSRIETVRPDHQPNLEALVELVNEQAPAFGLALAARQPKEIARLIRDPVKK